MGPKERNGVLRSVPIIQALFFLSFKKGLKVVFNGKTWRISLNCLALRFNLKKTLLFMLR